ncbi:MAG: M48 family metallopeptidase [Candidatus Coproplasma sp.]
MKIDYTVKYARRRTISLKIENDGSVIISCPFGTPKSEIDNFILSKRNWIEKHLNSVTQRNAEWADVINYKKILIGGKAYGLKFGNGNIIKDYIEINNLKSLRKLFIENFSSDFLSLFNSVCENCGLKANSVKFKDYKSMWGCCDGKNNITFNYKLMMLPRNLQIYIIVHELCHTLYHDHSKKFWGCVEKILPDYKQRIRQMKEYSFITRIY